VSDVIDANRYFLVTVVRADGRRPCTSDVLAKRLDEMQAHCDVYRRDTFLDGLIWVNVPTAQAFAARKCKEVIGSLGAGWLDYTHPSSSKDPESGPYLYLNKTLRPVCRVYDDTQGAFLTAIKPKFPWQSDTRFEQLRVAGSAYGCLGIAVPSRAPDLDWGTSRLRVVVKDVFSLEGLKTSLHSRAHYEVCPPAKATAALIQLFCDGNWTRGPAAILGLTKLSPQAHEEPLDAVDFPPAFNPRGDGYQSPAGGSSGSAAAVAAYDWVDCGIGTDTTGSGSLSALANGVWQFRPTANMHRLPGMFRTHDQFDSPCIFARNLDVFVSALEPWIPPAPPAPPAAKFPPFEIVYPLDYFPLPDKLQMNLIEEFLADATKHLAAGVRRISLQWEWGSSYPDVPDPDRGILDTYLRDAADHYLSRSFYYLRDTFRQRYGRRHGRQRPYVTDFVQRRWMQGQGVTRKMNSLASAKMNTYREWLLRHVFRKPTSDHIFILLPISGVTPCYRDDVPAIQTTPPNQSSLDQLLLPSILRGPVITVPIGNLPYISKVSGEKERLPVMVNLAAAPGEDWALLEAVRQILVLSGRPTEVKTGYRMF